MHNAQPIERAVGMEYYLSDGDGTGGRLRARPGDFRVRELERFGVEPVDADPGPYPELVCRVRLANWDTNDFARALSDELGISRERVSWAGTKDKRAVSTQLVSVRTPESGGHEALEAVDLDGVDIELLGGGAGGPLRFGDLAGNAFEVNVADPTHPERAEAISRELRAFGGADENSSVDDASPGETVGVPNYFGQQRFGSLRPVTHEVGLAIVRGDWSEAVLAYAGNPSEREPESTQAARAFVEELGTDGTRQDWGEALEALPRRLGFERAMVHELAENGARTEDDWRGALETLPSNLQRLFVNAAQSFLFNRMVSRRLDRGLPFDRALAGDTVCFLDGDAPAGLRLPDVGRSQRVTEARLETVDRHCAAGRAFVTAPLVGTQTEFADGKQGEIERSVCAEAGIEPSMFDLPGEFHSTGTRRAILLSTDLSIENDPLRFAFSLPKGSYATVLLREYLKVDPEALT